MSYSSSVYFIPVWFDDFNLFVSRLSGCGLWETVPEDEIRPRYLLNYAVHIAENRKIFHPFKLKNPSALNVYMFEEELSLKSIPEISQVRFSCFSTGVGFLEFWVNYKNMTPEEIVNFAYLFKKAAKNNEKELPYGRKSLYNTAKDLLPKGTKAELFFTSAAQFKYECNCFHYLHIEDTSSEGELSEKRLALFRRSYKTDFTMSADDSRYDMLYKPYPYDHWGGSPEGLVNITYDSDNDFTKYYINNLKISHLEIDYYFMYLLLLNQRYSAIQYITKIAEFSDGRKRDIEMLNRRIVRLKTVFSFEVISDDQICQNVYSKMYEILNIEPLLKDIRDNENQMEILRNESSVKADKLSSKFLFGISILSLFSALIDSSSFFDRVYWLEPFSTNLGLVSTGMVVAICLIWLFVTRNKN